ncbi:MAG: OmpA family protein [Flavobacteriaceae bacterium]|nr:OmpA family protein [Flavobacteriaceae bacterium]
MKKFTSISLTLAIIMSLTFSCTAIQNANSTQKGAGIGVAGGALVGGLIGGGIGGALIGAAVGGVAGGLIGNSMDNQADKIEDVVPGAEVKRVGEGIHVVFDDKSGVSFALNSSDLTSAAKDNLNAIAEVFTEFPDTDLMIEGYTDSTGDNAYNLSLSKKRAKSVESYLKSQGVGNSRFASVEGYGEANPRFSNDTKDGQAKNRRVEIGIVANDKMIQDAKAQAK